MRKRYCNTRVVVLYIKMHIDNFDIILQWKFLIGVVEGAVVVKVQQEPQHIKTMLCDISVRIKYTTKSMRRFKAK